MARHFLVFLLDVACVLTSCSKNAKHETSSEDSLGFHTTSSAYVREDKDSWTYVTENGSFHYKEVLGDKGTYEAVLLLEENYHNENTAWNRRDARRCDGQSMDNNESPSTRDAVDGT